MAKQYFVKTGFTLNLNGIEQKAAGAPSGSCNFRPGYYLESRLPEVVFNHPYFLSHAQVVNDDGTMQPALKVQPENPEEKIAMERDFFKPDGPIVDPSQLGLTVPTQADIETAQANADAAKAGDTQEAVDAQAAQDASDAAQAHADQQAADKKADIDAVNQGNQSAAESAASKAAEAERQQKTLEAEAMQKLRKDAQDIGITVDPTWTAQELQQKIDAELKRVNESPADDKSGDKTDDKSGDTSKAKGGKK